nr:uncharacterized protein LOC109149305 [Ipomoea trifida]
MSSTKLGDLVAELVTDPKGRPRGQVQVGRVGFRFSSDSLRVDLLRAYLTKMCPPLLDCFSEPGIPLPSGPPDSNPLKGLPIGLLISVVIPIFRHKFGSFLQIRSAIDKVEEIVHGVEKVAEVVEKVAEEIGENLPAGKLKDAVVLIEHVAEKADKYAQALGEFIDKVEEVGDKLEDGVESLVEVVHRQENEDDTVKVEKPPKVESL